MAYQTLPNTFTSGSTIYSTAVSAQFAAVLQGYTTGNYDGAFTDLTAKQISVNAGSVYLGSAGTGEFAGAVDVADGLTVGGSSTFSASMTVANIYTSSWTAYTPTVAAGWSASASSGFFKRIGKTVFVQVGLTGKTTADGALTVSLPVTAATGYAVWGLEEPCLTVASAAVYSNVPGTIQVVPENANMIVSKGPGGQIFSSSVTYWIGGKFWYEATTRT